MLNVQCDGCNQGIAFGIYSDIRNVNQSARGVYARAQSSGSTRALEGLAISNGHFAYGVHATANSSQALHNYGIRAQASNASSSNWAGYFVGSVYSSSGQWDGSDERLKKNIESLDRVDMLGRIQQLQPRSFQYLEEQELEQAGMSVFGTREGVHLGLIAQELEEIFPELVVDVTSILNDHSEMTEEPEEEETISTKAMNYTGLIPVLIAGMQEQQEQIDRLEARIATLEAMMQE